MHRSRSLLTLACLLPLAARAQDFSVVAHYPVGGEVRFDYLRVDPAMRRLYVSHAVQVDVLNADTGAKVGVVAPMKGVHGIALVPGLGKGYITSGGDRTVVVFDLKTLQVLKVITGLGTKPDAVEYDPATRRVYVANGQAGGISVIDPAEDAIAATIPVAGKLEGLAFDGRGHLFVNTEDQSVIQVVDTAALKVLARWPIAPAEGGTGLAIDTFHHRLFSAGGNKLLAVVDSDTGKVVATPEIGEDPDGDAFDPVRGLIFTSSRLGTITVVHEDRPDLYSVVQTVPTAFGARTIAFDQATGRVFVPGGQFGPATKGADGETRRPGIPGTFEILAVGR